jgi:hypothetical protein
LSATSHNHTPDINVLRKLRINLHLNERALNSKAGFTDAFTELIALDADNTTYNKKYENMRDDYNRKQTEALTRSVSTNDINEIPNQFKFTIGKKKFLYYDSGSNDPDRVTIFTTDVFLQHIGFAECWLGDATFKSTPKNQKQIYMLHGHAFKKTSPLLLH